MKAKKGPRLSRFELELMEKFWERGGSSVREIQESLTEKDRPAYTTVQTMVYRLEEKGALRRVKKIGNAQIFQAAITQKATHRRLIDELLSLFGGSAEPVVSHLVETGKLTLADIRELEKTMDEGGKKQL